MTDYDFRGLSPRSFEHLVQSLALREISARVIPFGDGPDGGREATFDGPTSYSLDNEVWEGYGVIQAKFKQRPEGSTKDGKWLVQQLVDELTDFNRTSRQRPDYYVVATNVVLSPGLDGPKDKAVAALKEFADSHDLRGFDIWDYDKLRVLIDHHEAIRRAYAAWITSGDVLSQLLEWMGDTRPDFHQILSKFLQKELLGDRYARLEQAGHSNEERIPLANVFVDLPISSEPSLEPPRQGFDQFHGFIELAMKYCAGRYAATGANTGTQRDKPRRAGRLVLIGGPGQGKTTLGQFLAQLYRASFLVDLDSSSLSHEAADAVDELAKHCETEDLEIPRTRRFPVRIVLSDLAASLSTGESKSLLAYITQLINNRTDADLSAMQVQTFLRAAPCLVILDGLDEVPASTNRDEVLEVVKEFLVDVASNGIDAVVIATSRPQGYNDDFSDQQYFHYWLVPLDVKHALHYAAQLAQVRFGSDPDRVGKIIGRLRRASVQESTARLMRSPLQVTIMTLLVDRMGQPPQERWNLFSEYYRVMYQRETERDIPSAAVLRNHQTDIDTIHHRVALLLQLESERSGGTDARLSEEQLSEVVNQRLVEEGHEGQLLEALQKSIIDAASQRLVFLVGLESGQVGFEIRSLQEFMAAEGLLQANDETRQARLREVAVNPHWRNVFLFAAGKCFSTVQYLRDTITTICSELNDHPVDRALNETHSGSILALELLEDGSMRRQPTYSRLLAHSALELLELPIDASFSRRLAEVFSESLREIFQSALDEALASPLAAVRDNATVALIRLSDLGDERFTEQTISLLKSSGGAVSWAVLDALATTTLKPLRSEFYEQLPRQPLQNVWFRIRHARMNTRVENDPEWLTALMRLEHGRPSALLRVELGGLAEKEGEVLRLGINPVGGEDPANLTKILQLNSGHPEWVALKAAAEFTLSPSPHTLARAITTANHADGPTTSHYMVKSFAPWPLAECLQAMADGVDGDLLGRNAVEEKLGNQSVWTSAQERWKIAGVVRADLEWTPEEGKPIDAEFAQRGFPFASVRTWDQIQVGGSRLLQLISKETSRAARSWLGQLAAMSIQDLEGPLPAAVVDTLWGIFEEQIEAGQWYWALEILDGLDWDPRNERLIRALDRYRLDPDRYPGWNEHDVYEKVRIAYESNPTEGLMNVLAEYARTREHFFRVGSLLVGEALHDEVSQVALLALRARQESPRRLLPEVIALKASLPSVVEVFLESIQFQERTEREEALLGLLKLIESPDDPARAAVLDALLRSLGERNSSILNQDRWTELAFPPGLRDVICST